MNVSPIRFWKKGCVLTGGYVGCYLVAMNFRYPLGKEFGFWKILLSGAYLVGLLVLVNVFKKLNKNGISVLGQCGFYFGSVGLVLICFVFAQFL